MASLTVARVRGIPVRLHVSFLLALPLFAYLMARSYFSDGAGAPAPASWGWGLLLALGLFGSVLLHELSHSLVALREGVAVESITLLPIGGVSSFSQPPREPGAELRITAVGPLTNFILGFPLLALGLRTPLPPDAGTFVSSLGALNLAIGAFNLLLPAFPMDGGRILRALLTTRLGRVRATRVAASIGRGLAVAMGLWGVLTLAAGGWLLVFVALFVYAGANLEEAGVRLLDALHGLLVADLMAEDLKPVAPETPLEAAFAPMLHAPHSVLPVADAEGRGLGILTLAVLEAVPPAVRPATRVEEIMLRDVPRLAPDQDAAEAGRLLGGGAWPALLVTDPRGALVGLVTPADVARGAEIVEARQAPRPSRRGPARRA